MSDRKETPDLMSKLSGLTTESTKTEEASAPPTPLQSSTEEKRPPEDKAATYRIGVTLIERINEAAKLHNVQKAGLVKTLLTYALDALDSGELPLEYDEPRGPRRLKP